jgi:hypothetical protein
MTEGTKGDDLVLVQRVYAVISDWNLNARPLTHRDLAERIATFVREYAREQVEANEDCGCPQHGTHNDQCPPWCEVRALRAQVQTLRGELDQHAIGYTSELVAQVAQLTQEKAALEARERALREELTKRIQFYEGKRRAYPDGEAWYRARRTEAEEILAVLAPSAPKG